jgi:osomolarity two-component system response regulator SKN7
MNDILPKPFTKEGLLQLLEKHLNHLKKHPNPTLDDIKHEDSAHHHAHMLHSPQKPHTPSSSTWTTTNSPQTSLNQQQSVLSPAQTDASDHSHSYAMYANAPTALNPNGLAYVAPPGTQPHVGSQRRPLDMSDAEMSNAKRQQQMFGPPGMGMRTR